MSFDLGVWYPQARTGNEEAGKLYLRLCDGDSSGVMPHPAIKEFYAELTARYPELGTIPAEKIEDHDHCPWSCKLDHSSGHVILSCVWPKATEVGRVVKDLARKHGLAIYDPQSDVVTYPDGSSGTRANSLALWVLSSFLLLFAAIFIYVGSVAPTTKTSPLAFYAMAGFCGLMAVACVRQALRQPHPQEAGGDGQKSQ
jgi:hypothetical protein